MSSQFLEDTLREANGRDYGRFFPREYAQRYRQREFVGIFQNLVQDKPMLPFLIPVFILAWLIERWIVPFSNWVPVCVTVWATIQYGRYQQRQIVEELNSRWKRHFLCAQPSTPLEPCEWFNKMILYIWPNYMQKRLSTRFRALVQRRVKEKKPRPIQSIEVHDFDLGKAPPVFGLQRTYWSREESQAVLHMGFEWVTNEMSVLLAAKLSAPFAGKVARININSIQIRGDLKLIPILDGQAVLYAFESTPDLKLGVAFGSGNQHLPATELPVVSLWLEKLFMDTLERTMVEPRRRCFSLPVHDLKRHATGGVLSVSVLNASNLPRVNSSKSGLNGRRSMSGSNSSGSDTSGTFVELTLGDLSRKTEISSEAEWNNPISMVFHGSEGSLHLKIYEQLTNSVKSDFLGTCEVKFKYVFDGSTTFWAIGRKCGVLAARVEHCGEEVEMVLPLENGRTGEIRAKLALKEWYFSEDTQMPITQPEEYRSARYLTGRMIKVKVIEGRNLAAKDRSGKSDPYIKLQYGKIQRKTKTVQQNLNPVWNQEFDFQEYGAGEYLKIKCYDADILMNDENMGSARINLHSLEVGKPKDVWIPLEKIDRGEIHLLLEAKESQVAADDYKTNILELVFVEAKDLVAADWNGTSDPYVSVRYGGVRKRTKVIYKNLNPRWNETMDLIDDGSVLELHVKDYNAVMPSAPIGHCVVEYSEQPVDQTVDRWIPLHGVSTGQIRIQITRRELQKQTTPVVKRQPSSRVEEVTSKAQGAVSKLYSLIEANEGREQVQNQLEELVNVEEEQKVLLLQLLKEKELLLSKVKELEQAMDGLDLSPTSVN